MKANTIINATHEGQINIGNWATNCYVLEDKRRIISFNNFIQIMSSNSKNKKTIKSILDVINPRDSKATKSIIELIKKLKKPIEFLSKDKIAHSGYEGTVITEFCRAVLNNRKWGYIKNAPIAQICEDIIMGLADVGITALIDEGSKYQIVRGNSELQDILDNYLSKYLQPWTKRFSDDFYENIFRLKDWDVKQFKTKKPKLLGKITKDIVYSRLAPKIIEELEKLNPLLSNNKRQAKHHQWLTPNLGQIALSGHLYGVIALMKCSDTWQSFYAKLQKTYPKFNEQLQLNLWDEYS